MRSSILILSLLFTGFSSKAGAYEGEDGCYELLKHNKTICLDGTASGIGSVSLAIFDTETRSLSACGQLNIRNRDYRTVRAGDTFVLAIENPEVQLYSLKTMISQIKDSL